MRLYLVFQTLRIIFNLVRPIKNLYKLTHNQTIMSSKAEAFRVCVCSLAFQFEMRFTHTILQGPNQCGDATKCISPKKQLFLH